MKGRTLNDVLRRERGDTDRLVALAKTLDEFGTERGKILALAFFASHYSKEAGGLLSDLAAKELRRLMRGGPWLPPRKRGTP